MRGDGILIIRINASTITSVDDTAHRRHSYNSQAMLVLKTPYPPKANTRTSPQAYVMIITTQSNIPDSEFEYSPRCEIPAAPCRVTLSIRFFRVTYSWPLCAIMTSSIKPEVYTI